MQYLAGTGKTDNGNEEGGNNNDDDNENGKDVQVEEHNLLELPYKDNDDDSTEEAQGNDGGEDRGGLDDNNDAGEDGVESDDSDDDSANETEVLQNQLADNNTLYHTYPEERETLQRMLTGTYECPVVAPGGLGQQSPLTKSEEISLQHYIAWRQSNGTELAYKLHAKVLQKATQIKILSLHAVKKLALKLSGIRANKYDICPDSCMAYTGEHAAKTKCTFEKKNESCKESRFNDKGKPQAQMIYVSCFDMIKAMYANAETSTMLRHRDKSLQRAMHMLDKTKDIIKTYSDFGDSNVQDHLHRNMDLFRDPRDVAFALSTDGAQLTMKKQSNIWIAVLIILNLPAEIRYKTNNVIVPFIVPGPQSPGDLESFMYPLFEDMAKASEGIWMWDAVDSSYFVNHAYICMILGDMLGSAKLSGMAGHSAVHGDRFSLVKGAHTSLKKGSKYQYYPMKPPQNDEYNKSRPSSYDLNSLPIRTENSYWDIIGKLNHAQSKRQINAITRETGICFTCIHTSFLLSTGPISPVF
jgi:hypothetical protein